MSAETAIELIRKNSKKLTPQRLEIFKSLVNSKKPMTAKEIHTKVKRAQPSIGLDTVYRNLIMLTDQGYVSKINLKSKATTLFEYQGENHHHHHAICLECDKVFCIDFCKLLKKLPIPDDDSGFAIKSHVFEIYGICTNCP